MEQAPWKLQVCTSSCCLDQYLTVTAAVDEIESEQPGIFGPDGGYLHALSISNMSWTLGSFLGPILSGSLVEQAGYYEMCRVLGMLLLLLGSMKTVTD